MGLQRGNRIHRIHAFGIGSEAYGPWRLNALHAAGGEIGHPVNCNLFLQVSNKQNLQLSLIQFSQVFSRKPSRSTTLCANADRRTFSAAPKSMIGDYT
jgi:hypothetical protein